MCIVHDFPGGSVVKNMPANAADSRVTGSTPGLGRSPGEGNGNPLQCFCLGNPMDRGAWWTTVHGITKNQKWLSDWTELVFTKPVIRTPSCIWQVHKRQTTLKKGFTGAFSEEATIETKPSCCFLGGPVVKNLPANAGFNLWARKIL